MKCVCVKYTLAPEVHIKGLNLEIRFLSLDLVHQNRVKLFQKQPKTEPHFLRQVQARVKVHPLKAVQLATAVSRQVSVKARPLQAVTLVHSPSVQGMLAVLVNLHVSVMHGARVSIHGFLGTPQAIQFLQVWRDREGMY